MIKIEIGKQYLCRDGTEVTCVAYNPYPYNATNDNYICVTNEKYPQLVWYFSNGNWMSEQQEPLEYYDKDIVSIKD